MSSSSSVQRVAIVLVGAGMVGLLGAWASRTSQPVPQRGEPATVQPQDARPAGRPGVNVVRDGRGQGAPEFRGVGQAMKAMDRGLSDVITNIDKAEERDRLIEVVAQMQRAAMFTKNAKFQGIEGEDPKEVQAEFRRHGIRNAIMMLDLELQLMQGKIDDAKATIKKIEEYRDKSHKEFHVGEDGGDNWNPLKAPPSGPVPAPAGGR